MVNRKSTARRAPKKAAKGSGDNSSLLQSFQENNLALAKALAKQKAMQKDYKELEAANSILKAKGKMCARQCKELIDVVDEHLHTVLAQVQSFVDTLMMLASILKKQKHKNEALLQMIESDEIAEVPVTTMSRTQLVNPMVGGHTLKKASINLQRLDMTNLNPVQNNVVIVDDDDEGNGRTGPGRLGGRPSLSRGANRGMVNGSDSPIEIQDDPVVVQENGVPPGSNVGSEEQDQGEDEDISIVEDRTVRNLHPMRRTSIGHLSNSSIGADTSAVLDESIQSKFPQHPLRMKRIPSVTLERLNLMQRLGTLASSQRQEQPNVPTAFRRPELENAVPLNATGSPSVRAQVADLVVSTGLSPKVSAAILEGSLSVSRVPAGSQDDEMLCYQEMARPGQRGSKRALVDLTAEPASAPDSRNLNPRVHLVDIGKPSSGDSTPRATPTKKAGEGAEVVLDKQLKVRLPKVNVGRDQFRRPSATRLNGASAAVHLEESNARSVLSKDNLSPTSSAYTVTPPKNRRRATSEEPTKLVPRVNLVDIVSQLPSKTPGANAGRRKIAPTPEKTAETDGGELLQVSRREIGRPSRLEQDSSLPAGSQRAASPVVSRNAVRFAVHRRRVASDVEPGNTAERNRTGQSPQKKLPPPSPSGKEMVFNIEPEEFLPPSLQRLVENTEEIQCAMNGTPRQLEFQQPAPRIPESSRESPVAPVMRMDDDPLEGPSWLYDTQDSRSGYYTRHHRNSDPTFCMGSSDEAESSYETVRTPKRKRKKYSENGKKSVRVYIKKRKPKPLENAQERRSLRISVKSKKKMTDGAGQASNS